MTLWKLAAKYPQARNNWNRYLLNSTDHNYSQVVQLSRLTATSVLSAFHKPSKAQPKQQQLCNSRLLEDCSTESVSRNLSALRLTRLNLLEDCSTESVNRNWSALRLTRLNRFAVGMQSFFVAPFCFLFS